MWLEFRQILHSACHGKGWLLCTLFFFPPPPSPPTVRIYRKLEVRINRCANLDCRKCATWRARAIERTVPRDHERDTASGMVCRLINLLPTVTYLYLIPAPPTVVSLSFLRQFLLFAFLFLYISLVHPWLNVVFLSFYSFLSSFFTCFHFFNLFTHLCPYSMKPFLHLQFLLIFLSWLLLFDYLFSSYPLPPSFFLSLFLFFFTPRITNRHIFLLFFFRISFFSICSMFIYLAYIFLRLFFGLSISLGSFSTYIHSF